MRRSWQHYAAPVAFLLAVTVAVVLIRAGFESGGGSSAPGAPTLPHTRVSTGTGTTTKKTTSSRFWTVRAGDTFAVIAAATGVSVKRIQKLNPRASSTSLFIGQKIRIR